MGTEEMKGQSGSERQTNGKLPVKLKDKMMEGWRDGELLRRGWMKQCMQGKKREAGDGFSLADVLHCTILRCTWKLSEVIY